MKIECVDKEIGDVFKSFYKIPRFQRPYSWERENVEEFWNDTIAEQETDYFIGSFVLFKDKGGFGIVDGQQRLTTLTMMLCALRNAFKVNGLEDLARGVHNLIERTDINNQLMYVLDSESSYPYLQEHIQKFSAPSVPADMGPEERLLKESFEFIVEQVNAVVGGIIQDPSVPEDARQGRVESKLLEVRDKLLKLKVIYTLLDNEDDAYTIFETLNTRGKDLTVSDLLKTLLTRLIKQPNKGVDTTKDRWNSVLEVFEQSQVPISVNSFLHHFWLSKYEYLAEKRLYKAMKKTIKRENAEAVLNTLVRESKYYRQLYEPGFKKWNKDDLVIPRSLEALNLFRVRQQVPMTLALISHYDGKNLKSKHVKDALNAIESFHFCFTAVASQRSSGGISSMYASCARNLNLAPSLQGRLEVLSSLKEKLRDKVPSAGEFVARFIEIKHSTKFTKQKDLVRYILGRFADRHCKGAPVDHDQMTIEHLSPENPKKPLLNEVETASVGNLLFVNRQLQEKLKNKEFVEKKRILSTSNIWIDDVIRDATTWGSEEVLNRGKLLATTAYDKLWKF